MARRPKVCAFCKKRVHAWLCGGGSGFYSGGTITISFGYGSRFDGEEWSGFVCDECCAGQMFRKFVKKNVLCPEG